MRRLRRSFEIEWIDLLSPDCWWPHPYGLECALLAWSYLVRTASNEKYAKYGCSGAVDLLCKKPTCVNHIQTDPIVSIDDLRERFHWALLSQYDNPQTVAWKTDNRIGVTQTCEIPGRHFRPMAPGGGFACEADVRQAFVNLLGVRHDKLNVQLNSCHRSARWIHRVYLNVRPSGNQVWQFDYGFRNDFGSHWCGVLAMQTRGEPPIDLMRRAMTRLEEITQ